MDIPASEGDRPDRDGGTEAIVADDDDFFRLAMASILRGRHGIAVVHEVGSFDAAVRVLAERRAVTFASFDLDMPGMADVGQLHPLRLAYPGTRLAIVSATFDRAVVLRALAAGAHGYILKMAGAAQLGRAVGHVLDGEIHVPAALAEVRSHRDAIAQSRPMLTRRQQQVLDMIGRGATNRDIAAELGLGEGTVKVHVAGVLKALGVANRGAAALSLREAGRSMSTKP